MELFFKMFTRDRLRNIEKNHVCFAFIIEEDLMMGMGSIITFLM
jgi:hypothetical protein